MTPTEIPVDLGERAYPVRIGRSLDGLLGTLTERQRRTAAVAVVDERVWALHGHRIRTAFAGAALSPAVIALPPGETTKSLEHYERLCHRFAELGVERGALVIAIGGGVIGDLTGFVAATYQRGLRWIPVPTTLLAMVDASVGGKTGINFGGAKNALGAFHQPEAVLADVSFLETLEPRDHVSGLAEVVKAAVIRDAELFDEIEGQAASLVDPAHPGLETVIARAVAVKAAVVAADERESGGRAVLNFGHTFAHALEAATGFERFSHGEAVAIGMTCAAALSITGAGLAAGESERIRSCLGRLGLPTADPGTPAEAVAAWLGRDKKRAGGEPRFVLTPRIGSATFGHRIPQVHVNQILARFFGNQNEGADPARTEP